MDGGKPKAEAAAENLKKIFPEVDAQGFKIPIPMPGHLVASEQQIKDLIESLNVIEELVKTHDAVFLLTDTRESRWLPTLLAAKYNKVFLFFFFLVDFFMLNL